MKRSHLAKRIFEIDAQGQKCQNGKVAIFCQIAILALLSLCIDFKNSFCQMTSFWVLWKTYYWLLLKKCLWPCPGPSMYLSERINWIISSFPHRISKILFVLGSWDNFESLRCKIGTGHLFWYLSFWKNTVTPDTRVGTSAWNANWLYLTLWPWAQLQLEIEIDWETWSLFF